MSKGIRQLTIAVSLVVSVLSGRSAAGPNGASVAGAVLGPDGIDLPGVQLRLVDLSTGAEQRATSGEGGLFHLTGLDAGSYRLEAQLAGFEPMSLDLTIAPGEARPVTLRLSIAMLRERVEVVGRSPRDSLEATAIRESRARDVGEALGEVPGVWMLRKGAIANEVVLRGLQSRDLTVVIDGQRIYGACPNHMDPPAFHVDFAEVQRIELAKGPFDVKNQGGLGGVVNIVTARPPSGWHGTMNLTAASATTFAPSAALSYGTGHVSLLGGVSGRRGDAYVDGSGRLFTAAANYRPDHQDTRAYSAKTGWGRVAWAARPGTTTEISATRQTSDAVLYPYLQMDGVIDDADRVAARVAVADVAGAWSQLAADVYFTRVDHWMTDEFRLSSAAASRSYSMGIDAKTRTIGGGFEARWRGLTVGSEVFERRHDAVRETSPRYVPSHSIPDVSVVTAGGFAEHTRSVGRSTELTFGGRLDRARSAADPALANSALLLAYHGTSSTSRADLLPAGHVRAVVRPGNRWRVAAGVGRAVRSPEPQERYMALARMGADTVGNPLLRPAGNTGFDVEATWTSGGVQLTASAYVYRLDDFITVRDQPRQRMVAGVTNLTARSYANVDALMHGIEATLAWSIARTWSVSTDLSHVRGTFRNGPTDDRDLPEIPPARGRVRVRFDDGRLMAGLDLVAATGQAHVSRALLESPTPGYVVANARAAVRSGRVTVTAGIDNILDRTYREHLSYYRDPYRSGAAVYEPGRTFSTNVAWAF